jgi:hypothetical protein
VVIFRRYLLALFRSKGFDLYIPPGISVKANVSPVFDSTDTVAPVSEKEEVVVSVNFTVLLSVITLGESTLLRSTPSITRNLLSTCTAGGLYGFLQPIYIDIQIKAGIMMYRSCFILKSEIV